MRERTSKATEGGANKMEQSTLMLRRVVAPMVALACFALGATAGWADDAEDGRELYIKTCTKCHGLITEDAVSWTPEALLNQAVTMPLGPPLSGVYMRPAGIMEGYPYSRAFRSALENPWVWDEDALNGWLTSTQDFIRGSTMFLKVEDEPRAKIIAYLKRYATYKGDE
jgi:cytochrome c2